MKLPILGAIVRLPDNLGEGIITYIGRTGYTVKTTNASYSISTTATAFNNAECTMIQTLAKPDGKPCTNEIELRKYFPEYFI